MRLRKADEGKHVIAHHRAMPPASEVLSAAIAATTKPLVSSRLDALLREGVLKSARTTCRWAFPGVRKPHASDRKEVVEHDRERKLQPIAQHDVTRNGVEKEAGSRLGSSSSRHVSQCPTLPMLRSSRIDDAVAPAAVFQTRVASPDYMAPGDVAGRTSQGAFRLHRPNPLRCSIPAPQVHVSARREVAATLEPDEAERST